jgi:SAM-dependent methyltransferase
MDRAERLRTELAFQADRAAGIGRLRPTPEHVIARYGEARSWRRYPAEFLFAHLKDIRDRDVLDFGCGDGASSVILARLGARVTALDISPALIDVARRRAVLNGVADRIRFLERDLTAAPLPANRFDIVVCSLVLHHVEVRSVVPLIMAALRPGGTALILEPIAFSPWLQWVRDHVPVDKRASPGERPLNEAEVEFVCAQLAAPERTYFNLLGRLRRLFPNRHSTDTGHPLTRAGLFLLYSLDRVLLTVLPGLGRYSGTVAIVGRKPIPAGAPVAGAVARDRRVAAAAVASPALAASPAAAPGR